MAKKIRFPLKLAEDKEVRTLDELREHFDLEKVLEYYKNGKLLTWLEDRYLEGEAEAVRGLDETKPDFQRQLCAVFQVDYTGDDVDLEEIERRQERLKRLRSITDNAEFIQSIDLVAFDQEDLADLLDEGQKRIYLCGETFQIPVSQKDVTYIGINEPVIHLTGNLPKDAREIGIKYENCRPDNWPENAPTSVKEFLTQASQQLSTKELTVELSVDGASELVRESLDDLFEKITFHSLPLQMQGEDGTKHNSSITTPGHIELKVLEDASSGQYWERSLIAEIYTAHAEVVGFHLDSGRKGYRTIQVDLRNPVILGGVQYDHIPVQSAQYFEELGLREGTLINIYQTGDVMPTISVLEKGYGKALPLPEKCPHCNNRLVIKNKKLYCENPNCEGNLVGRVLGFLEGIGMDGYGESFVNDLVSVYHLANFNALFDITTSKLKVAGLTGKIHKEFTDKLQEALAETPDYKIFGSIGIPGIGPARAKMILHIGGGWETFSRDWSTNGILGFSLNKFQGSDLWDSLGIDTQKIINHESTHDLFKLLRPYVKNITTKFDDDRTGGLPIKIRVFLEGIGMERYSERFVDDLMETYREVYRLESLVDLFDITEQRLDDVGMTDKLYSNFANDLRRAVANTADYQILGSIGIPDVDPARARTTLMENGGWTKFIKKMIDSDKKYRVTSNTIPSIAARAARELGRLAEPDTKKVGYDPQVIELLKVLYKYVKNVTT